MELADGWNHNNHYHETLLSVVPRPCRSALDVGCGLGTFSRRLMDVAKHVDALERDSAVLARAREFTHGVRRPSYIEADFMTWNGSGHYDFVSMIATLHHLLFTEALTKAVGMLNSGGILAVLGLSRSPSLIEAAVTGAIAYPVSRYYRLSRRTSPVGASTLDPSMTLAEIRRAASDVVPGAIIRRRLLWRYTLIWTK